MHAPIRTSKILSALYFLLVLQTLVIFSAFTYSVMTTELRFGGDFVTFWLRAKAVVAGDLARIYDLSLFRNIPESAELLAKTVFTVFPYPPTFLLYLWPLGHFPLHAAMALWLVVTGALYFYAVFRSQEWQHCRDASCMHKGLLVAFVLLSPFVLSNIMTAQTGFLTGALLILGLTLLDKKPYMAGVCFGLLCFKPQLGVLLPFALLGGRHYTALLTAAVMAFVLMFASYCLWGANLWLEYPEYLAKFGDLVMKAPTMLVGLYCSFFHYARQVMPLPVAAAIQCALIVIAAFTVWKAFASDTHREYRNSILIAVTFLAAPHSMGYDMTLMILPALYMTLQMCRGRVGMIGFVPYLLLLLLLPLNLNAINRMGIPAGFIVTSLFFLSLITHFKGGKER